MSTMSEAKEDEKDGAEPGHRPPHGKRKRWSQILTLAAAAVLVALVAATGYIYAVSPGPIRQPAMEHYHFRLQVVVNGQPVDFGGQPFQTAYDKGQCSADLSEQPIHFHDQKDQFVHIHWQGMTGGLVLKNYGWNFVGGAGNKLGYRLDGLPRLKSVPIHGQNLPALAGNETFWVYTGDGQGYQKRLFDDFKKQNLEDFFGKASNFRTAAAPAGLVDRLFPKAYAHGGEAHSHASGAETETDEERLTRINNLLGNVVIFVQPSEPSDPHIKARFADLEPLSDSTCGG